jgi:hypothetical protein
MNAVQKGAVYSANFWRGNGKPQRMPNPAQNLSFFKESPRYETQQGPLLVAFGCRGGVGDYSSAVQYLEK